MNKFSMTKIIKNTRTMLEKRSPEILMGIGITGMITTTILAVQATPKALELLEEEKRNRIKQSETIDDAVLSNVDVVKTCWKCYVPAATTCIFSIACLVGAGSVHARRNAALATAYKLSETALSDYRDKVIETIGEKKEQAIKDKVNQERVEKNPVATKEVIFTGKGDTLCLDVTSKRYFKSDIDKIKKAVNDINWRMLNNDYVSLNEFYSEIGLTETSLGDDLGWSIADGYLEIYFGAALTDDGEPCIVLDYSIAPKYGYNRYA